MIKGVGIDIVEISRIKKAITKRDRFAQRVFTKSEREYCQGRPRPWRHFAARFAAKEAVSKALGTGKSGMSWTDIEIARDKLGRPHILLSGGGAQRARENGVKEIAISLSFDKNSAVASAIAIGSAD